jgi:lipopolysaccharide heptosyltransferase II
VKAGRTSLEPGDRVLVTRLDYLGDVVLSLPLVDALAARWPGIEIDYLTRSPAADLLAGETHAGRISRVFTLERGGGFMDSLRLIRALRRRRYRAVIDLYSNPRSAWLSWFTGARVRVGGDRRGRRHLYTHPMRVGAEVRAATAHHLSYGAPLGVKAEATRPVLHIGAEEAEGARAALRAAGVDTGTQRPLVGIHPGGKWSVKRWPTEKFAGLVSLLRSRMNAEVVVFTGPGEEMHTHALRAAVGDGVHYLDVMPIRDLAAVVSVLDAMVACDGGVMHVAVACGTPTVGIFGSAEPEVWFPYQGLGPFKAAFKPLPCRPCHRHECPLGHTDCLNGLHADRVFEDVSAVLRSGEVSGHR